ncbi:MULTISPECIES: MFS transporter [unclassified Brenneria]|uniref:MFS transporter n=1 Tax=unclassified Brenneria TaxID=2634434 RepID=UPI001553BD9F|nr:MULTISPECIES: MFS transporter [unclassified Brenneria]MBJ7222132.1 MFS transporter [Brenneria sp. L3-3C-1]MEE3643375.1 MFS transporter [Brenneria sp. L3_3C_1]MEE3651560.1 MFS transporter [Brenneria sp. HEZEL_4_2_4]NPD01517.1 MFS transporter [Brenneria sp. hezel4-2-4]
MPISPSSEPAVGALRLNLRIVSVVIFNFASYLTIGLPLAVLPGYVHDGLGYSAFWAGLVISLQYFSTLLSRPRAGRYADEKGPKQVVVWGLAGAMLSGVCYLLAAWNEASPAMALFLLCVGRLILGAGQSFAGTGATLWGAGLVGSRHIGRVISWNGIATYGAMAIGAPLGVWLNHIGGLKLLSIFIILVAAIAMIFASWRPTVKVTPGKKIPFREVLGKVWVYGVILALASAGFGVIATFITLFYADRNWEGAALTLTIFSCAFVGARLLFPNSINRFGGLHVALACFVVEIIGLLLVWGATQPLMAELGALLAGAGFSLVFPALGVVAVKMVSPQNQGSALATYTIFLDLSLGVVGPAAGVLMGYTGIASIYLAAAILGLGGLLLTWRLRRRDVR